MHHEASIIATIAMSLLFAFGGGWIASRLKLPPLVGYLVAGIAVGPFTPGYVANTGIAQELAEIGVILLMFGVGLHFSVRELWAVRWIAIPGAVAQIAVATTIGWLLSSMWGWNLAAGLMFGLALSVASTVVLLRALEERHAVHTLNGRIAIGWLIVEDLAMVVALVMVPALASSAGGTETTLAEIWPALGATLAKVAVFVGIVLVVGRRVVPWILDQVARQGSRELFTLAVLALALGIAYLSATLFGVSFALGAFFAGVVMSESDLSHQATADSLPLKDAFAVLFFVSVGMLFNPAVLLEAPFAVLGVLLVIIVGKSLAAFAIVLLFRYPISTALMVSASLAQIGEFSFILAALGMSLNILPAEGQTYILAGALLSIALNPLVFKSLGPIEDWILRHPRLHALLERPSHSELSDLPPELAEGTLSGHAVIAGFGRVGETIARALEKEKVPYVVVEQNRQMVLSLRKRGLTVVCGDASVPEVLETAAITHAKLLVVAVPDGFHVRRVVDIAKHANPRLFVVARTHSDAERQHLERQGVDIAVMGERELALTMMGYALHGVGVDPQVAEMVVRGFRNTDTGKEAGHGTG